MAKSPGERRSVETQIDDFPLDGKASNKEMLDAMLEADAKSPFPQYQELGEKIKKVFDTNSKIFEADDLWDTKLQMLGGLVKRISQTFITQQKARNQFERFMKAKSAAYYGDFLQEIGADIVEGQEYQGMSNPQDQFEVFETPTKTAYHPINKKMVYPVTIGDAALTQAFVEENGLSSLFGYWFQRVHDVQVKDDQLFFQRLISNYLAFGKTGANKGVFKLNPAQIIEISDLVREPARDIKGQEKDVADLRDAIWKFKSRGFEMTQNSRDFNMSGFLHAPDAGAFETLIDYRADILNETVNLVQAYNENQNAWKIGGKLQVPTFGQGGENIIAVLAEGGTFNGQIVKESVAPSGNNRNLYVTYWHHDWKIFWGSPFKNCTFFVKEGTKAKMVKHFC